MTNPQCIEDIYDWLLGQFAECADLEYREMQRTRGISTWTKSKVEVKWSGVLQ